MAKINQEEYEVLKEALNDGYNWLDRNMYNKLIVHRLRTKKRDHWIQFIWGNAGNGYKEIDEKLFQFIQWEDEVPYNIAELIEDYEFENVLSDEERFHELYNANESEETEVKKDIEWLTEEVIEKIRIAELYLSEHAGGRHLYYQGNMETAEEVLYLIDQLDEPEILSREFINEKAVEVYADTTDAEVHAVFRMRDLQNLLVPDQELPVIPKFVAEYIDDRKEVSFPLYQAIRIVRENSRFEHSHLREWLWTNKGQETFARAWLDGYEVAEEREQKYYVDLESAAYVAKWDGNDQVDIYTDGISGSDEYELHLTEQEIKDYDKRYFPFAVKVEELEE